MTDIMKGDLAEPLLENTQAETEEASQTMDNYRVFSIEREELKELFDYNNSVRFDMTERPAYVSRSLSLLKRLGGTETIAHKLLSDPSTGINGDPHDITRRVFSFGENKMPPPQIQGFWSRAKAELLSGLSQLLLFTATLSVLVGLLALTQGVTEPDIYLYLFDGLGIYLAMAFIALVTAMCYYVKDKQF